MMLKAEERLDDLQVNGLKIIQNPKKYCFTSDAVLLANTVKAGAKHKVCDLCAGSGIIGILIASKQKAKEVVCIELQADMAEMAERSVKLNNLDDKVSVLNVSAQDAYKTLGLECFDIVVSNPPYGKVGVGETVKDEGKAICRNELKLTLAELVCAAARLTKFGGKFYMIHRADRLAEIIYELKEVSLEPKNITLIYPKSDKLPDTVIFECIKGGKAGVKLHRLVVFNDDNTYTVGAKRLYSIV